MRLPISPFAAKQTRFFAAEQQQLISAMEGRRAGKHMLTYAVLGTPNRENTETDVIDCRLYRFRIAR
jgi:hypothetical protein